MSNNGNKIFCDIDDLMDFGNLDDLLKQSGIQIGNSNNDTNQKTNNKDQKENCIDIHDPFSDAILPEVKSEKDLDNCLICCNPLYIKLTLPCAHNFCLNCIKGQIVRLGYKQSAKCPLCNQLISDDLKYKIKNKPHLLKSVEVKTTYFENLDAYWFYSDRSGQYWWSFDIPSSTEIENLYKKHSNDEKISKLNRLSICGMTRIYDFDRMLQINDYNGNTRHIKRIEKNNIQSFIDQGKIKGLCGYKA